MSYLDDEWCADQIFGVPGGKKKRSSFLFDYDELIDTLNKTLNKEENNKKENTNMNNNTNAKGDNFSINFDTDFENFIHAVGRWNDKEYSSTVTASQCKDNIFDFNEAKNIAYDEVIDKILKIKNKKNIEVGDIVTLNDYNCFTRMKPDWFINNNIKFGYVVEYNYNSFPDCAQNYCVVAIVNNKALIESVSSEGVFIVPVDSLTLVEKGEAK